MKFLDRFFKPKQSRVKFYNYLPFLDSSFGLGSLPFSYYALAHEGYMKNTTAMSCVDKIKDSIAGLKIDLYDLTTDKIVEDHDIIELLNFPNITQEKKDFIKEAFLHILVGGECFIEKLPYQSNFPIEMWTVRPDKVSVEGLNGDRFPRNYRTSVGSRGQMIYNVDPITGKSDLIHIKIHSPIDTLRGLSPMLVSSSFIDIYNKAVNWNRSLLNNCLAHGGVIRLSDSLAKEGRSINAEQKKILEESLRQRSQGSDNAGMPLILSGGLEWVQDSMNNKELDLVKSLGLTARDICKGFKVPPELVGVEAPTFKNYEEARASFYEDTIIPQAEWFYNKLILNLFSIEDARRYEFKVDRMKIESLQKSKQSIYEMLNASTFLTDNEKREVLGYPPMEGGDQLGTSIPSDPPANEDEEEDEEDLDLDDDDDDDEKQRIAFVSGKAFNLNNKQSRFEFLDSKLSKLDFYTSRTNTLVKTFFLDQSERIKHLIISREIVNETDLKNVVNEVLELTESNLQDILVTQGRAIMLSFGKDVLRSIKSSTMKKDIYENRLAKFETSIDFYLAEEVGRKIKGIQDTSKGRIYDKIATIFEDVIDLETEVTTERLTASVQGLFKDMTKSRARTIARTESHNLATKAEVEAAKVSEVLKTKEWIHSMSPTARGMGLNDSTNHISMDGVKVSLDQKFKVPSKDGMDDMDRPGDSSAPADQVVNCNCVLAFSQEEVKE